MRRVLRAIALTALVGLGAGCGGSADGARTLAGMVRTPTPTVSIPPASGADGAPVTFPAPPNGLALVYFGYTSCPDICPTTLSDLRAATADLGDDSERLDLTFVTIDPERDTQEIVDGYVASFVAGSSGLRVTDPDQLQALADAFGASFSREVAPDGTVEVGHTAFLYALDGDGRLLVQWPFGTTRNELHDDLRTLLDRMESPDDD